MKTDELLILGLAGVAVYMIWKTQGARSAAGVSPSKPLASGADTFVDEIFSAAGLPFNNGWRYFENGVAIAPNGDYYQNGAKVWSAQ